MHGNGKRLEEETSKLFNLFLINSTNPDPSKFQGVCTDDVPSVEDIVRINIFIYVIDLTDGAIVWEPARRSVKKYENNVQLIRYNSHFCYVDNIHALFTAFGCPSCVTYFQKTGNLESHLVRCSERVKHIYAKNAYQRINSEKRFLISVTRSISNTQIIRNYLIFELFLTLSLSVYRKKNSKTTTWIGIHVPISVSISSNLIAMPIFICNSKPRDLVESLIDAVEGIATQSKAQMKLNVLEVETAIKSKLTRAL